MQCLAWMYVKGLSFLQMAQSAVEHSRKWVWIFFILLQCGTVHAVFLQLAACTSTAAAATSRRCCEAAPPELPLLLPPPDEREGGALEEPPLLPELVVRDLAQLAIGQDLHTDAHHDAPALALHLAQQHGVGRNLGDEGVDRSLATELELPALLS